MPIRTIEDKRYRGISELYRKSDGAVTGYYVTYRDAEGKPVKRRVEAEDRDEALRQLAEIKKEIELKKEDKNMSAVPTIRPKAVRAPVAEKPDAGEKKRAKPAADALQSMHACQKHISAFKGKATVMLMDIVAFDDICILYGYEDASRFVAETESLIMERLAEMEREGLFSKLGFTAPDFELHHLYADRFCLFLKNDFPHRLLDHIVETLTGCVSKHAFRVADGGSIDLNVTVGAAGAEGGLSLVHAEKALKEAKRLNNGYLFFDCRSAEHTAHLVNKTYETLVDNIREKRVTPFFQGIFSADAPERPAKFESLMRLVDDRGRVLSPGVFLEKSKEYRLYTQLMFQMIDKVCDVLDRYRVEITLNLSFQDINNVQICERLIGRLERGGIGGRLTVEILESDQIRDIELVNAFIFKLKRYGVRIAIDDFGSGFSNFDNLLNLDIDYVKFDGSLVAKLHDRKHRIILQNMVRICRELGIKTVGEYICDLGVMRMAESIGIDYLQGYHLHKPQSWSQAARTFGLEEVDHAS